MDARREAAAEQLPGPAGAPLEAVGGGVGASGGAGLPDFQDGGADAAAEKGVPAAGGEAARHAGAAGATGGGRRHRAEEVAKPEVPRHQ